MFRVAIRPRFLGLLALMVAATVVCGLLATWQWDRAHMAMTDDADGAEQLGDIRGVLEVGDAVTNAIVGDTVTVTGRYVDGEQVVVPGRLLEDTEAVIVVSSLLVDLEDGTQVRLPVARGWLPAAELTGPDGTLDAARAPAPPTGEIALSGRLEASEAAQEGIEDGIAGRIATPMLVNEWGAPMYSGYLALNAPPGALQTLPEAESEFSRGLDWQNLGYSLQWVLFGGFFLYLWWRSVRSVHLDEVADRREAMEAMLAESQGADGATAPPAASAAESARPTVAVGPTPSAAASATAPTSDKDV